MKKSLVFALVLCFVLSIASTVLAFPVDFTGDFRLQGRSIDDKNGAVVAKDGSWWQLRGRLNFEGKIDDSTTFYGRITTRNDFGGANTSTTEFDQYGVKIAADAWKFNIGRQAVNLGQGTIISTGSDAAGVDNKFDGLVAATKWGKVDTSIIAGKTNNANGAAVREWYGIDLSTKLDDKFAVGAAYASGKKTGVLETALKTWAVNVTFNPSANLAFNAEYAKSNATDLNKAYFFAGTYSWDKDSFTVQYNKVQPNAVDQYNSGIGSVAYPFWGANLDNYKGFTYVYSHPMTKAASLHVIYMDLKNTTGAVSDKELAAGVQWKF